MTEAEQLRAAWAYAYERAVAYREGVEDAPPAPTGSLAELREGFDIGVPEDGRDPVEIVTQLANTAEKGLTALTGPNFFAWVQSGSNPVGMAAEFMTVGWGQNCGTFETSPANAVAEEVSQKYLLDLLDLPRQSSIGFTTGATMASFICLSAARTHVLEQVGWGLEENGLIGAPEVKVFLSEEAHATIHSDLRYLGFGERQKVAIASDDQCRMKANDLADKIQDHEGPKIIISQAGHINAGSFDDFEAISDIATAHGAWHHVDGAFGLWARATAARRHLCAGIDRADSWSVDGHKWLQVPYDSGFAIVKDPAAHIRAMDTSASYIEPDPDTGRNPGQFVPELSRRARGFSAWATIQALGRNGIEEMVDRHCACAEHLRDRLTGQAGITVVNDVVLNQVAIAFGEDADPAETRAEHAKAIAGAIRAANVSYVRTAMWKGMGILRVSVISGTTQTRHLDVLADAILAEWEKRRPH